MMINKCDGCIMLNCCEDFAQCCCTQVKEYGKAIEQRVRADVIDEIETTMYHQCFECDNDEDMQKWDCGNWIRYKLFENVLKQLKEK